MRSGNKKRFSSEYTMLAILEYLYVNSQKTPVSKYNIVTNTKGIKQQRPDRINILMDMLERNGYIKSVKTSSNVTYYQISDSGVDAYLKWIKDFLDFARKANRESPK
jgi:DNA-binding PadR family transcriptional regulator